MTVAVLGLDGGGTKTDVAVVDRSGRVLTRARFGGLDPTAGPDWEQHLAGIAAKVGPVTAAVLGLPYYGEIAPVSARQCAVAAALFGPNNRVQNDVAVAFEGALAGADGVLILAGTGSMAWARGPDGEHRVGGWGDVFGDEGSAWWIGRAALNLISQQLDGRQPVRGFADAMLTKIGIAEGDLISWTYGLPNPRANIAGLAELVSALAQAGDADALALMQDAARQLAQLGLTAARLCSAPLCWSTAGGVMRDPTVRGVLAASMGCAPTLPILPPVGGAVLRAAKAAGWDTGPEFIARLKSELDQNPQVTAQTAPESTNHANHH